ncbi:hypothetical protein ACH4GG_27380 [Streptomyces albidoflavus]|uniref:hypothetical protein n=1 Tax=Streptomyces albidoflavus TaxID=1886 RepID=UPI000B1A45E4|nr:hypothetical protein [Streptomyces albidoflavus]RZE18383.1 hypothetical protein C0Q96_28805 [Streptomyces albidoflavus]
MTTIATPPAAALDALLDRLSAGKPLTADEAALLRAGVTGLRRTAGGLQRRSQQQAARIAELEAVARATATARDEFVAEQRHTATPAEEIAHHAMGLGYRLDAAEAALGRVRRLCELTMTASMRVDARHQAIDTLAALDGAAPEPPLRDRLAAAIRAATCPGECEGAAYCEHGRFQPTVWDDQQRPVEVGVSGPPERIAALIAVALAGEAS